MRPDPQRFLDLSAGQRKSGLATWPGWMFDGFDVHIYRLVASAFVAILPNGRASQRQFSSLDGNFRKTLPYDGFLFIPAMLFTLLLPAAANEC